MRPRLAVSVLSRRGLGLDIESPPPGSRHRICHLPPENVKLVLLLRSVFCFVKPSQGDPSGRMPRPLAPGSQARGSAENALASGFPRPELHRLGTRAGRGFQTGLENAWLCQAILKKKEKQNFFFLKSINLDSLTPAATT